MATSQNYSSPTPTVQEDTAMRTNKINPIMRTLAVLLALCCGLLGLTVVTAAPASANSSGQCSGPRSVVSKTAQQLLANWKSEKITAQAAIVEKAAGYTKADGTFERWILDRDIVAPTAKATKVNNYMCKNGKLIKHGTRIIPKGTLVHVVLPSKYAKSDIRTSAPAKKDAKKYKVVTVCTKFIAQTSCSNPGSGTACVKLWVKIDVKVVAPAPKPVVTPTTPTTPVTPVNCGAGLVLIGNTCSPQTNSSSQDASQKTDTTTAVANDCERNASSCNTTVVNTTINVVNQTTTQNNIVIVANCSDVTIVVEGQVYQDASGNNCNTTTVVTPPATPVAPSIVDYTVLNDVDAGASSSNVCVTYVVPSNDPATVYFATGIPAVPATATSPRIPAVAGLGSFSPSSIQVTGSGRVCSTYTAPADNGATSDKIYFFVVDTATNLSTDSAVQSFPVNVRVHP